MNIPPSSPVDETFRKRGFRVRRLAVVGVLFLILALSVALRPRASKVTDPIIEGGRTDIPGTADDRHHVGSLVCAGCHREIAETYAAHPMARSARPILEEVALAGRQPPNPVSGEVWTYDVTYERDRLVHHERMFDAAGEEIYNLAVPMDFAIGSGRRAKAYLHQRNGLLLMSPLNWYAQANRWDFSPGYSGHDLRRFDRRVTDECLSCHTGRVATSSEGRNLYRSPPFHETAIGCENCHGPGAEHVAAARQEPVGAAVAAIVNPSRLSPSRRDAVCYQCHLQASVRVTRSGRTDFDFRPGMEIDEVWTVLDEGSEVDGEGRTRSVGHVQEMRASRCFTQSAGGLGCISCHDPHRVPDENRRQEFYRERCLSCHQTNHPCPEPIDRRQLVEDSCIVCHMPARESNNITHVSQTDHRVPRRPAPISTAPAPAEAALSFFDRADLRLSEAEKKRALGLGIGKYLSKKGILPPESLIGMLLEGLVAVPDDGTVLIAVGSMAYQRRDYGLAETFFGRARGLPGFEEQALSGLLDLHYLQQRWEEVIAESTRLREIDPGDVRAHTLRAEALVRVGRVAEGLESAGRALKLNPSLIPVRDMVSRELRRLGRSVEADAQDAVINRLRQANPRSSSPH